MKKILGHGKFHLLLEYQALELIFVDWFVTKVNGALLLLPYKW